MATDAAMAWLRLAFTPGLPAAHARTLLEAFGDPGAIFATNNHDHVTLARGLANDLNHFADAGCVAHRRSAVFLHDSGHGVVCGD